MNEIIKIDPLEYGLEITKAQEQSELNKNDSDKIKDLIQELDNIKSKYGFTSNNNIVMFHSVKIQISKIINFINKG